MILEPEKWENPLNILVILAHPDDPEFFCGATIARWTHAGHNVMYCLLTSGDKGGNGEVTSSAALASEREQEQINAAGKLGVLKVDFLHYPDGYLVPDLPLRRDIVRVIRKFQPDIVVGCDPTYYFRDGYINHPDHRAAGQAVIDAVAPAAGNPLFFQELQEEGLHPHSIKELWLSLTMQPDVEIDVTEFWHLKIMALQEHRTQIGNPDEFYHRMMTRRTQESNEESPRFMERFRRFVFK